MRDDNEMVHGVQRAIREQLDARGISLKVVAAQSGITYSSLCGYFPGNERGSTPRAPTELPLSAIRKLHRALPADILNLLAPEGWAIVRLPCEVDFDEVDKVCRDFCATKAAAHHPESEAGRDIGPSEAAKLSLVIPLGKVA